MATNHLITLTVNEVMQQELNGNIERLFGWVKPKPAAPDYGSDDLRNARLVGAYHAHKGAGGKYLHQWKTSLNFQDRLWIGIYEHQGRWGNTTTHPPAFAAAVVGLSGYYVGAKLEEKLNGICAISTRSLLEVKQGFTAWLPTIEYSSVDAADYCYQLALSGKPLPWERGYKEEPPRSLEEAAERFSRNLGAGFASIGRSFAAAGENMARSFATGLQPTDPEEFLIMVERIDLRHNLERILIPASVACWLARRWPTWALPAVAWVRLQNQMAHEGGIVLNWWRRVTRG